MANIQTVAGRAIVDVLTDDREPLPGWLANDQPPQFNRDNFFGSRTVYYPGSGTDRHPVKLCNRSDAAHTFIYVDHEVEWDTLEQWLHDQRLGFLGYEVVHQEELSEDALRLGGWTQLDPFRQGSATPFARFVVLDRQHGRGDDHGPERFAILFIGGDGYASYDALYCQGDETPPPFLVVIQDHGFAGNYDRFGRDGRLECIARRSGVLPEYLLVGKSSKEWRGFVDTGAHPKRGGMHCTARRLFMRIDDNLESVVSTFLHESGDRQNIEDPNFIRDQINSLRRAIEYIVRSTKNRDAEPLIRKLKFHEARVNKILQRWRCG